mgnify:CR=1 FL=1
MAKFSVKKPLTVFVVVLAIVVLGVVDDIMALPAKLKFVIQIVAALIPALNGVSIQALSNPNIFSANAYWVLNWLSVPITVLWIVGITNAVNLIDGLDGLACGVSTISAISMLVIALLVSESDVALVMAALVGACLRGPNTGFQQRRSGWRASGPRRRGTRRRAPRRSARRT